MYSGEYDACDVTLNVYPHRASVSVYPHRCGYAHRSVYPHRCGYTLRVTSQASYSPEYITPTQKNHSYHCLFCQQTFNYSLLSVCSAHPYTYQWLQISSPQNSHGYMEGKNSQRVVLSQVS